MRGWFIKCEGGFANCPLPLSFFVAAAVRSGSQLVLVLSLLQHHYHCPNLQRGGHEGRSKREEEWTFAWSSLKRISIHVCVPLQNVL